MDFKNVLIAALIAFVIASVVYGQDEGYGLRRRPGPGTGSRRRCRWGSVGICGGFVNAQCPAGSTCRHVWPTATAGLCCRNRPEKPVCEFGSSGSCGGFVGQQCSHGYTCQYLTGSTLGTCCKAKPVKEMCPYGQNGVCGTIAGRMCRRGTTCKFMGNFPDAGGKCCINTPRISKGRCPRSSGMVGICLFDPKVNCLSDDECTRGQLCCSEGCGSVCKNPVF